MIRKHHGSQLSLSGGCENNKILRPFQKRAFFSSQARSLAPLLSHMPFAYVLVGDDNGTAQVAQTILALAQMPLGYVLQTTKSRHN